MFLFTVYGRINLMNRIVKVLVLSLVSLACSFNLQAATTYNWDATASQPLDNPSSWNPDGLPGSADTAIINNGGTATAPTNPFSVDWLELGTASGAGTVDQSSGNVSANTYVIVGFGGAGTYKISGGSLAVANTSDHGIHVGLTGNGMMDISGTASVSTRFLNVGAAGSTTQGAAIYQSGTSTVTVYGNGFNCGSGHPVTALGDAIYGYYKMAGGNLNLLTDLIAPSQSSNFGISYNAPAVFDQTGGTVTLGNNTGRALENTVIGWGTGTGVLNVTGGLYRQYNVHPANGILVGLGSTGTGVCNIGGTGVIDTAQGLVAGRFSVGLGGTGIANLGSVGSGGGTLKAGYVDGGANSTFNFHGGTLDASVPGFTMAGLTNAFIYSEGATINSGTSSPTIAQGFSDPTYSGIKHIDVGNGGGSGYLGAPVVTISSSTGSGSGATAVAVMNGDQVDHFVITNPGSGYSDSDSLLVTLSGGGTTNPATASIGSGSTYFTANSGGGLHKVGAGTLTMSAANAYTGLTSVEEGTLSVTGSIAGDVVVLKDAALGGNSAVYGTVTVQGDSAGGGAIAPGVPNGTLNVGSLKLQNNAKVSFDLSNALGNDQIIVTNGDVVEDPVNTTITVPVNLSGTTGSSYPINLIYLYSGVLDPHNKINFTLPTPTLDSVDGANSSQATLQELPNALQMTPAGVFTDPQWNTTQTGKTWNNAANWTGTNPPPLTGGQRALFTGTLNAYGPVPVALDLSPTLSSMIFNNPTGESYAISTAPGHSGESITLDSSLATDWHITVLGGEHTVEAKINMDAGTGHSAIRLVDNSHLTLGGVLANAGALAAGLTFNGGFDPNGYGSTGTGVLTLSGTASSYTGPTTLVAGILEVAKFADAGSNSSVGAPTATDPSYLVLKSGTLRYTGAGDNTNRGLTVEGTVILQLNGDLALSGRFSGDTASKLYVAGPGTLTYGYTGATASTLGQLFVNNGSLSLADGAALATSDRCDIGNLGSGHVVLSGTSTTAPAVLSIGGASWMGMNFDGSGSGLYVPSSALIELSGTAEMHVGTAHPDTNCHLGLGAESSGTINMTGHSKFTVEIAPAYDDVNWGWFNLGDLGGTADINLSNNASFSVTESNMCIGGTAGGKGRITLNDSATFTVARYVHVGGWDGAVGDEASITLNGGVFTAMQFIAEGPAAVINFNGGALKAAADSDDFLKGTTFTVNVQANGAAIDTDNFTVTVTQNLQHDAGAPVIDGGLTKLGDGILTLTGKLTYTGLTDVREGLLQITYASDPIDLPGDIASSTGLGDLTVADGVDLTTPSITVNTLTIGGGVKATTAPVPEPSTWLLLVLAGLGGLAAARRR
jgi:autotransporter-associated beta strand protein